MGPGLKLYAISSGQQIMEGVVFQTVTRFKAKPVIFSHTPIRRVDNALKFPRYSNPRILPSCLGDR